VMQSRSVLTAEPTLLQIPNLLYQLPVNVARGNPHVTTSDSRSPWKSRI